MNCDNPSRYKRIKKSKVSNFVKLQILLENRNASDMEGMDVSFCDHFFL